VGEGEAWIERVYEVKITLHLEIGLTGGHGYGMVILGNYVNLFWILCAETCTGPTTQPVLSK
jgi:hypothetical protein